MKSATVQDGPEGAVLTIHVQPKAARTEFAGLHGGALKFRVAAPPTDGVANEALYQYLAERFGLSKGRVILCAGSASRRKRVLLKGVPSRVVREVLQVASF